MPQTPEQWAWFVFFAGGAIGGIAFLCRLTMIFALFVGEIIVERAANKRLELWRKNDGRTE